MRRLALLTVCLGLILGAGGPAAFVGDASVWESNTYFVPPELWGVTGGGQLNGGFWIKNASLKTGPVQVGIRAQERRIGPLFPVGRKYFAETGIDDTPSPDPDRAWWNFDFHVDFGLPDGIGPSDHVMEDFAVLLTLDCDPAKGNRPVTLPLEASDFRIPGTPIIGENIKLLQQSWNMKFDFLQSICLEQGIPSGFDENAEGEYEFGIAVRQRNKGKGKGNAGLGRVVAQQFMTVVVSNP